MRRIHVAAFKMAPKYQKEPVQVFTRWLIHQKEPVRLFTRWRIRLGPERFQKLDLLFWRSSFRTWLYRQRIDGTVSRSRVNKRPIRHEFWIGTIWNRSRLNIAIVSRKEQRNPKSCKSNSSRSEISRAEGPTVVKAARIRAKNKFISIYRWRCPSCCLATVQTQFVWRQKKGRLLGSDRLEDRLASEAICSCYATGQKRPGLVTTSQTRPRILH